MSQPIKNPLAERAMLAGLKISQWSARRLDKKVTDETNRQHAASADAGRYNKALLAKDALAGIGAAVSQARTLHYAKTLPWLDDGARILPARAYEAFAIEMKAIRHKFEEAVRAFVENYPTYVEHARVRLNGMFDANDYPAPSEIGKRFTLDVRILPMPDASDFRVEIGEGQAEDIRREIEASTREALEFAMKDTWTRIIRVTERVVEKLNGYKPSGDDSKAEGIFRDSLIENVRELVAILPAFNLTLDPVLIDITERLEKQLCKHDADVLRDDEAVRNETAKAAEAILADITAYLA